jgi:hypothetical protein
VRTRLLARGGLALVLALTPLATLATPAYADGGPPAVSTAWFWNEKTVSVQGQSLPTLPDQGNAASGVPDGDLGVGYVAEQLAPVDKVAAIDFDLTSIPVGSTFSLFSVKVPLDAAANQAQTATADISACENIDAFKDGTAPQDISKAPPVAVQTCVKGVFVNGAYTFDLTPIANDWSVGTPEFGISIRPTVLDATSQRPFSIALSGKNAITTRASWTPPPASIPAAPVVPAPVLTPVADAPVLSGGGGNLPVAPPVEPAPVVPQPQPQPNPAPQTTAINPVAYAAPTLVPSTLWWLALLGLAGLLGLSWLLQNDPLVPAPVDARRQRFARAVRTQVAH